ncbi:MAG: alkaline phosphatase family protein [Gemmatimonadaceae bacterium]|nr:alkaline phosphatase family protein [Gemmatimonadaceae bacterium]
MGHSRTPFPTLLVCAVLLATLGGATPLDAQATPRKAVFILLDGIPADVIETTPTPAIDAIAAAGGYARAYVGGELGGPTETPTISAPGYMSLITGTWANKHNVRGNYGLRPNYDYWNVFRIVETVDASKRTAVFSTWTDNRTILVGEGQPGAGDFRIDHAADGFEKDSIAFPPSLGQLRIAAIDDRVATEAAAFIHNEGPDLSWVYLQYTDDVGHASGQGEAFSTAVSRADDLVGRIWAAVQHRQSLGEDWMIVVTTDHGRDAETGKGHGGNSARERTTWIATNHAALTQRYTTQTPGIVDIAPSILQHLGIVLPAAVAAQMEGVSFLAPATPGRQP